jgi:hypothetical protein
VANVYLDTDVVSVDGTKTCADGASQAVWTTYSLDGKTIGSGESRADLADVPGNELMGLAVDAQGNLYVARAYTVVDDAGEWQATGFRIGRFTQSGQLDRSYGTNGVVEVSEPRFDWRGTIAADAQGRVYLATTSNDDDGNPTVVVVRFTSSGSLDKTTAGSAVTSTTATANTSAEDNAASDGGGTGAGRRERTAARNEIVSEKAELATEERQRAAVIDTLPANNGLTVATEMPVLTSVKAIEDRSLTVTWALSVAIGRPYVTATATPGGRSCTSTEGSCVIRGLEPTESYVVTLAKKGEDAAAVTLADVTETKPVVSMRLGRVASPTTFVRPASRGKATWKVRGGCTLNETNTRITAPKSPTVCVLSVTTAKDGTTPKTTRSVTIVVKK